MEFDKSAVMQINLNTVTTYESGCLGSNIYAYQSAHYFKGKGFVLEELDIRNATSIASDAFSNTNGFFKLHLNADQIQYLNGNIVRGGNANHYYQTFYVYIYGGETAETAATLTSGVWTTNVWYWGGNTMRANYNFKGYVNAFDGADGLENQNGYGFDFCNYFFESDDAFNHYLESVKKTTNSSTTLTRYAKCNKGYFNVCNGDGTYTPYDITYADGTVTLNEATKVATLPTNSVILAGKCTPSALCMVCDKELEKGLDHDLKTTVSYKNGYLSSGLKTEECQRENCSHVKTTEQNAIFTFNGYSINEEGTELCVGYYVDNIDLNEYNKYSETKLSFGVVATIADEGESLSLSYDNGIINANLENTVIAPVDSKYLGFDFKITGFKDYEEGDTVDLKALNLVMCAYAYDGEFYFIGSADAKDYCEKSASTVTFATIENKVAE